MDQTSNLNRAKIMKDNKSITFLNLWTQSSNYRKIYTQNVDIRKEKKLIGLVSN